MDKKIYKDFLPVFRSTGKYSGNPRDLDKEFNVLQEPDPDDPEIWLHEERHEESFKDHLIKTREYLWKNVNFDDTEFYCCGQSHIDIAWRWRYWQTYRKSVVTYKKAVWHINHHDGYTFAASQAVLLDWIMREDPGLFDQIKEAVKTGRFDLVGGMWVESDAHLPSGEAFVRQRLYGQRFYLEHFGKLSDIEWLPDTFGYASTLPQIFLKSGSKYFYTTKLHSNKETKFPFIQFRWRSPDGSELLALINPGGFGALAAHNAMKPRRRLLKPGASLDADYTVDKPEDMDVFSEEIPPICSFFGKGDGGHGPTGEEVAVADYLMSIKPMKWITATRYFQEKIEPLRDRLPIWNDELYYEFHRGTITTQDLVKRMNRYFEWRICTIESLASLISTLKDIDGNKWQHEIERIWKFTLLNQFHDVLPGSSIPEAYDDCYDIWEVAKQELTDIEAKAWNELLGIKDESYAKSNKMAIYNGIGFDAHDLPVEIPITSEINPKSVIIDGKVSPVQIIDEDTFELDEILLKRSRRMLFTTSIPQHAFKVIELSDSSPSNPGQGKVVEDENEITLENNMYAVKISKTSGNITSIIFKAVNKDILTKPGIQINPFFDWTMSEQCWNILPGFREMEIEAKPPVRVEILEHGPLRWTVEIEREIFNADSESKSNDVSKLLQRVSIISGAPGIYMDFLVDWHTCECTVKVDINTSTGAKETIAEVPYGTNARLTNPTANHDVPRWENFHHTWVDMPSSDKTWGLAVINKGQYGYDAKGSRLGLTLIRGPLYPTPSGESWVNVERKERHDKLGNWQPSHADMGTHLIQYILLPHEGSWKESKPFIPSYAHWFNEGYSSKMMPKNDANIPAERPIWVEGTDADLSIIKKQEDGKGIVVRIIETKSRDNTATIHLHPDLNMKSVIEVDLLERPLDASGINTKSKGDYITEIDLSLKPQEIKTLLIQK